MGWQLCTSPCRQTVLVATRRLLLFLSLRVIEAEAGVAGSAMAAAVAGIENGIAAVRSQLVHHLVASQCEAAVAAAAAVAHCRA
jgi:hypothetical protein